MYSCTVILYPSVPDTHVGHDQVSRLMGCPYFGGGFVHKAIMGTLYSVLNTWVSTFHEGEFEGVHCTQIISV